MKEIKEFSVKRFPLGVIIVNFDKKMILTRSLKKQECNNRKAREERPISKANRIKSVEYKNVKLLLLDTVSIDGLI